MNTEIENEEWRPMIEWKEDWSLLRVKVTWKSRDYLLQNYLVFIFTFTITTSVIF